MSNYERNKKAVDDFFNSFSFKDKASVAEFFDALKPPDRATRYVRADVSVTLYGIFHIFKLRFGRDSSAVLVNISSQGVLITCKRQLKINKQLTLHFKFNSGLEFTVEGQVVNKRGRAPRHHYGIKFNRNHDELGRYLLMTHNQALLNKMKPHDSM